LLAAALNHLLRTQSWARARLGRFAGKTVRLRIFPLDAVLAVGEGGDFAAAAEGSTADAELSLSPFGLARWLAGGAVGLHLVRIGGDSALAQEVGAVLGQLRWDVEEDLSRVFGDIAAHQMVRTGRALLQWQRRAIEGLGRQFAEYWTEEQPLLARPDEVRRFLAEVDEARDAAERLEKRLERLEALSPHEPQK